jgi:tagatose-6-phosphate ketose/aldose isomerase
MNGSVNPHSPVSSLSALRAASPETCQELGCADTLREILQQPTTWCGTARRAAQPGLHESLDRLLQRAPSHIVLTGSGSSLYVGECLAPVLQAALGVPCRAIAAGTLMTDRDAVFPRGNGLLVSIARSGNSPESVAVVDAVLSESPEYQHLAITCNAEGQLATRYAGEPRMHVWLLDAVTNDRSLVMTSSFTNLLLAGSALTRNEVSAPAAETAEMLLARHGDDLARWGSSDFDAAVFLGGGASLGAAREAALKLLEMSAGAVRVLTETSLGLRHGPMAWLNRDSLLVSFLSGDPSVRAYEADLLRELSRKELGRRRIVVGEGIDDDLIGADGLAVELPGLYALPAAQQAMIHVVVGQLLALFKCLALGQKPDAPSEGVLTRVVEAFTLHAGDDA